MRTRRVQPFTEQGGQLPQEFSRKRQPHANTAEPCATSNPSQGLASSNSVQASGNTEAPANTLPSNVLTRTKPEEQHGHRSKAHERSHSEESADAEVDTTVSSAQAPLNEQESQHSSYEQQQQEQQHQEDMESLSEQGASSDPLAPSTERNCLGEQDGEEPCISVTHTARLDPGANPTASTPPQQTCLAREHAGSRQSSSPSNGPYTPGRVARHNNSDRITRVGSGDAGSSSPEEPPATRPTTSPPRRALYTRSTTNDASSIEDEDPDPHRQARIRWIEINRRFQITIAIVAFIFSILLFAILVSWVVLTSTYVVTIEQSCDVPLKVFYWLFTIQLILDVFRTEIIRFFFHWEATSNQRMPWRVIAYNVGYIAYAFLVMRMGVISVFFTPETSCDSTAPTFFHAARTVISLSLMAWFTIIFGYVVPFFIVATMLTLNGYNPTAENSNGARQEFTIFPSTTRAPPGCIERLPEVRLENFNEDHPRECCICMEPFTGTEVIVETQCQHVFHKQCFREWLQQARTCPVCRTDIPNTLSGAGGDADDNNDGGDTPEAAPPSIRRGTAPFVTRHDIHSEVVSLIHSMRRRDPTRLRRSESAEGATVTRVVELRDEPTRRMNQQIRDRTASMEEGRLMR